MLFRVDPGSELGLADQIAAQVRGAVARGELLPGEKLPAARHVAAGLKVNMHTVLRAYGTLRDEGLIDLRRGRGAVVHADIDPATWRIEGQIRDLARAASRLGYSASEISDAVRAAMTSPTPDRKDSRP